MAYVRLNHSEKIYGEKNLLTCQVDTLNILKNMKAYSKLRTEELAAKILLRKKIGELQDELKVLEKILPKDQKIKKEIKEKTKKERKHNLESEIEEIRRRIEKLK